MLSQMSDKDKKEELKKNIFGTASKVSIDTGNSSGKKLFGSIFGKKAEDLAKPSEKAIFTIDALKKVKEPEKPKPEEEKKEPSSKPSLF